MRSGARHFSSEQLQALIQYISNGNNFAFGFDPDCHFWNNGISFEIFTAPQAVPEPATMALLGTGLAGLYNRRRQQQQRGEQVCSRPTRRQPFSLPISPRRAARNLRSRRACTFSAHARGPRFDRVAALA